MKPIEERVAIDALTVGPFQTNIYLVSCLETGEAAIVDAGGDAPGMMALVEKRGVRVTKILQTHAHIDHIGAIATLREETGAPIYLHEADLPLYRAAPQQGAMFGIPIDSNLPEIDHFLHDGETVSVGSLSARNIHLPGHSPGGVAFYFEELGVALAGDILFAGSIGRVDLPGSDIRAVRDSLARIIELPREVVVLPVHGPQTTIGAEIDSNPFLREGALG